MQQRRVAAGRMAAGLLACWAALTGQEATNRTVWDDMHIKGPARKIIDTSQEL